jgi:hypothetical protein
MLWILKEEGIIDNVNLCSILVDSRSIGIFVECAIAV